MSVPLALTLKRFLRGLRTNPLFALLTIVTLGLAIAANVAIFAVVDTVLLRPLRVEEPEELVSLWHEAPSLMADELPISEGLFFYYRDEATQLQALTLIAQGQVGVEGLRGASRVESVSVSGEYFRVYRHPTLLGRPLGEPDDRPDAERVVVLSEAFWRNELGADAQVVGSSLRIDGYPHEVVGVMPRGFHFPTPENALWLPLRLDRSEARLGAFSGRGIGRLAPGASVESLQRELTVLVGAIGEVFADDPASVFFSGDRLRPTPRPLRDDIVGEARDALALLMGAVAFLMLVACANVANLFLIRVEERADDLRIRAALGEGRGAQIVSQLGEAVALGLSAAAFGLAVAWLLLLALRRWGPRELPRIEELAVHPEVVLFAALLGLVSGLLFGAIGLLRGRIWRSGAGLLSGVRTSAGRERQRLRGSLVAAQVATSLLLVIAAGLMLRSYFRLAAVDLGFEHRSLLSMQIALPETESADREALASFYRTVLEDLRSLPGVDTVVAVETLPLGDERTGAGHTIEGRQRAPGEPPPILFQKRVSEGYFRAMKIPLLAGRPFDARDVIDGRRVAIVSSIVAERQWPGESAIGKRVRAGREPQEGESWYEIIGVVGDTRDQRLDADPTELIYYPLKTEFAGVTPTSLYLVLETSLPVASLSRQLRERLWALNGDLALAELGPLSALVRRALARAAFTTSLLLLASGIALLVGLVGLYAIVSYLVRCRRREIAIRLAIGARPVDVRAQVLRSSGLLIGFGLAGGLLAAALMGRYLRAVLFETPAFDPWIFAAAAVIVSVAALSACLAPAYRASRVDPASVLHQE